MNEKKKIIFGSEILDLIKLGNLVVTDEGAYLNIPVKDNDGNPHWITFVAIITPLKGIKEGNERGAS